MQTAVPGLVVQVLRVLMSAPVVLASESLWAGREGAAVWAGVPLHVFSGRCGLVRKVRPVGEGGRTPFRWDGGRFCGSGDRIVWIGVGLMMRRPEGYGKGGQVRERHSFVRRIRGFSCLVVLWPRYRRPESRCGSPHLWNQLKRGLLDSNLPG